MMPDTRADLYRKLPSIDELLRTTSLKVLIENEGPSTVTDAARTVLARLRDEIAAGTVQEKNISVALTGLGEAIERQVRHGLRYSLRQTINATGVILHTNLGRAPISRVALEHVLDIARTYCNLEFDIDTGERGSRDVHADRLFRKLFESAQQGNSTARHDSFLNGSSSGAESISDAILLLVHFNLTGAANLQKGHTSGELGKTFIQFLLNFTLFNKFHQNKPFHNRKWKPQVRPGFVQSASGCPLRCLCHAESGCHPW